MRSCTTAALPVVFLGHWDVGGCIAIHDRTSALLPILSAQDCCRAHSCRRQLSRPAPQRVCTCRGYHHTPPFYSQNRCIAAFLSFLHSVFLSFLLSFTHSFFLSFSRSLSLSLSRAARSFSSTCPSGLFRVVSLMALISRSSQEFREKSAKLEGP